MFRESREAVVDAILGHAGLGVFQLGHVEEEAVFPDDLALGVAERERSVPDPHDPAVGSHHPVVGEVRALAREERLALGLRLRAVLGMLSRARA